jgi:ABC-type sugar transport system ATPase subunit
MAAITLEHVSKVFANGVQAVHELSLTVGEGELLVLVGPSGCGKTTTLRLIAGLEEPTAGLIRLAGREVNREPPWRRDVALVFQRPALYPHLTVRGNLEFGLRLRQYDGWLRRLIRWREKRQQRQARLGRIVEVARLLELTDVLDRRPEQISGGQGQRVALGRALVRQAAAYLLDEPLSNLDTRLRLEMRRELHLLQRRLRATMVYVTHDPAEAMALGDRIAVLDRGVLQQTGRPADLYERPHNRLVANALGWPAMNFFHGRVVQEEDSFFFRGDGLRLPLPPGPFGRRAAKEEQPLTLGVRPEDVRPKPTGGSAWTLQSRAILVEYLGGVRLVTFQHAAGQLVGAAEGRDTVTEGETVVLHMPWDKTYWFDRSTGLALHPEGPDG